MKLIEIDLRCTRNIKIDAYDRMSRIVITDFVIGYCGSNIAVIDFTDSGVIKIDVYYLIELVNLDFHTPDIAGIHFHGWASTIFISSALISLTHINYFRIIHIFLPSILHLFLRNLSKPSKK